MYNFLNMQLTIKNGSMKKLFLLSAAMMLGVMLSAQTQQGYVKTKGRIVNGQLVPGQGLKGAAVSIKGRAAVLVNTDDGAFSFPVTETHFHVDSVQKKGYQLVDMDALSKTYKHSANPIYLVMETPEQQLQDQLAAERKIRRTLTRQLHEREDEIEDLKEQQKISDEEYRQALQKLYEETDQNEQLVKDMVERFSTIDYDQLDEFYRQVSYCIENGELVKADSLLRTKGDVAQQVEKQLRKGQAIKEQEEQLNRAKTVYSADMNELAKRCFSYYETLAAQHMNDSAAYYLELRAELDTLNVTWKLELGNFISTYLANYEKALNIYQEACQQSLFIYGENNINTVNCYNNIGSIYGELDQDSIALQYYSKALDISKKLLGSQHPDLITNYTNVGHTYLAFGDHETALGYFEKAWNIIESNHETNSSNAALVYDHFSGLFLEKGEYKKAYEYAKKSLIIRQSIFPENHPLIANCYRELGFILSQQGNYEDAINYYNKALSIRTSIYDSSHPKISYLYLNIGEVYEGLGNYQTAMSFFKKAKSNLK